MESKGQFEKNCPLHYTESDGRTVNDIQVQRARISESTIRFA